VTKVKPKEIGLSPEAIAVADRLHSAAIHLLRQVRKHDVATGQARAPVSPVRPGFRGPKTLGSGRS